MSSSEVANRFRDCNDLTELIYQGVGAASTTWSTGHGNQVFNDVEAKQIASEIIDRIRDGIKDTHGFVSVSA